MSREFLKIPTLEYVISLQVYVKEPVKEPVVRFGVKSDRSRGTWRIKCKEEAKGANGGEWRIDILKI